MKLIQKLGFTALITASVSAASFAQMYGGLHLGYTVPTANSVLGTTTVATTTSTVTENVYGTNGTGFNAGLNFGYMFSEHFGLDLAASYIANSPVVSSKAESPLGKATFTTTGSQIRVTPSLIVSAGGEGISPYARLGAVLPVGGESLTTIETTAGANTSKTQYKSTGAFSLGFNSAIGVNIPFGEKMSIFGELNLTTLSIKGATRSLVLSETNGTAADLSKLKTSQKEVVFVDKTDSSTTQNVDEAVKVLATTSNYNSLGLMVGLRYKF
jgi:opacity protein-like surface antigen